MQYINFIDLIIVKECLSLNFLHSLFCMLSVSFMDWIFGNLIYCSLHLILSGIWKQHNQNQCTYLHFKLLSTVLLKSISCITIYSDTLLIRDMLTRWDTRKSTGGPLKNASK